MEQATRNPRGRGMAIRSSRTGCGKETVTSSAGSSDSSSAGYPRILADVVRGDVVELLRQRLVLALFCDRARLALRQVDALQEDRGERHLAHDLLAEVLAVGHPVLLEARALVADRALVLHELRLLGHGRLEIRRRFLAGSIEHVLRQAYGT